ncbi:MAG: hypothetical protein OEU09_01570 [Rhodospirillales bacterium]|nr:hypothetical protein [Rhodospirillales bacterium]MDH3965581.1 hypothetical protein [Rhodospirillales bacterium]
MPFRFFQLFAFLMALGLAGPALSKEPKKKGWIIYPPGALDKAGGDYIRLEPVEEPSLEDIAAIVEPLKGASLIRVEFDEYQLGLVFSDGPPLALWTEIVFLESDDAKDPKVYSVGDGPKDFSFMSLLGKTVTDVEPNAARDLLLRFQNFGSLRIRRDEALLESYIIGSDFRGSWLVVR